VQIGAEPTTGRLLADEAFPKTHWLFPGNPEHMTIAAQGTMLPDSAKSRRRRVAVVVSKFGLVGGGELFASEVTRRLARRDDLEVHVFANKWDSNVDGITFHKVPNLRFPRFLRPLFFSGTAQLMVDRGKFDLVHSHERIFRADIFSLHSVPHRGWVRDVRKKRPSLFDRMVIAIEQRMLAANKFSWFCPVSSISREAFLREFANLPGNWQVIHPGVDVARFSAPERAACRAEIRSLYGVDPADHLVLFVGMNFEVKGLDTIVEALAKARSMRPETVIRLLIVGRGNERKYRRFAESLGVADAVIFAGTQTRGLERYYRAADMFALLSRYDTFGMVVLEAMAAGLPVIVSSNVGAKDLVEENGNGFVLADGRDSDAAASRMLQLLENGRRESMSRAALRTATVHDWDRLAEAIGRIYDTIFRSKLSG